VKPPKLDLMKHLRGYFMAGVLITAPIGLTFYFAWAVVHWIDSQVTPLIPERYNPETYLPFTLPGLGLLIVLIVLTLVGALTAGILGRFWVRTTERILNRMPIIRGIYGAIKQIFETVLAKKTQAFSSVVLVEYPRRGIWTIAFITSTPEGEIPDLIDDELINVYVPTTPNPTSGFLLFLPKRDAIFLSMTVEEGLKMVISGGIVTPPDRRPPGERRKRIGPSPAVLPASRPVEPSEVD
jgi:uncharacterized membrane protein